MKNCDTCKIHDEVMNSKEPACCVWLMENVICGNKTVKECEVYKQKEE